MERLTNKKEADAQRVEYERRLANGYPRNIPEERFLRLAAYEDTGLEPQEIERIVSAHRQGCLATRKTGHWIGEGDGYADGFMVYDVWRCSECDYCIDDGTDDPDLLPRFCPECGAEMSGGPGYD